MAKTVDRSRETIVDDIFGIAQTIVLYRGGNSASAENIKTALDDTFNLFPWLTYGLRIDIKSKLLKQFGRNG